MREPTSVVLVALVMLTITGPISSALAQEGPAVRVSGITFDYVHDFAALTSPQEQARLRRQEVELGVGPDGYVAPRGDVEVVTRTIGDIGREMPEQFHVSALHTIANALRQNLEAHHGDRFFVALNPRDVDPRTGEDRRPRTRQNVRYRIEYTGPTYLIDDFELQYAFEELDGHPRLDDPSHIEVELIYTEDAGYVAWRPDMEPVRMTLAEISRRDTERYSAAAVQQVLVAVRDHFTDRQFMAVRVAPSQRELDQAADQAMTVPLLVVSGVVTEMRTLAAGQRIPVEERVNHPAHRRILERSPVQPGVEGRQMMRRDQLDDYIYRLGRHPGRRVDVGVAPAEEDLTVALDYIVTENRPLMLYGQLSNTGTRQIGRLRQRFGLFHNQLTGNDDILNIDYNTANFSDSHTVVGYYEAPFFDMDRIRWRVTGMWSEFDASEVGLARLRFTGDSWAVGGEVSANIFQHRQLFLDLVGGARFMHVSVRNYFEGIQIVSGSEDFFLPYAGLRLERQTEKSTTLASAMFEFNIGGVTSLDQDGLNRLGRFEPDKDWVVFRWDAFQSLYLEPLLNPEGFRDVATPQSSTLAHEVAMGFKGQHAFGNRLIPQAQMVAGGLYTVRGYPESVTAGDTVLIGTLEYRFHLPRAFNLQEQPGELLGQPFRWAPQHVYGRADWDLILRAFLDGGYTMQSDRRNFERDNALIGTGIGLEFLFRRNVNLRVDWGFALRGIEDEVSAGSSRVHFAATFLF